MGATLGDIRTSRRSRGGASYDISWAQDSKGRRVWLPMILLFGSTDQWQAELRGLLAIDRVPWWWKERSNA